MPEEAVEGVKKVVRKVRDDSRELIEETRRTRRDLTPMPLRRFLREKLKRRER